MNLSNVLDEKKYLEEQIKSIDLDLKNMPKKEFFSSKNGKSYKWYEVDGKGQHYIRKNRRPYAEKLAMRKYLLAKKKDLQQELTAINFYLRHHQTTERESMKLLSNPAYKELLDSYFESVDQEFQEWMNFPYQRNESFPESLIFKTNMGITVRSKSEMLIVMLLHMKRILFLGNKWYNTFN